MAKIINVGGRLHSTEVGNVLTGANEILDDVKGKKQNVINSEVSEELTRLDQSKQDNLTFDNTPTENSNNPVKSSGVYAADKALSDAIEAILLLIPSAATALNQLADKAFVNSSVSTATATFRGTYNVVTDLELAYDATHEQIATKLGQVIATADNNDYAFVQVPVSATSTDIRRTERYKFNGTVWGYEYDLNTSGFTAAQWEAINSGITALLVSKLTNLPTAEVLATMFADKQNVLTFDAAPTALSTNPVYSGGVYSDIKAITDLIPAEATNLNQLADKAYVLAQILAATPAFKGQFETLVELQAVQSPKAGDLGIVRTKDSDGYDVFTFYQYLNNDWNVFYTLSRHLQTKPATTGTTGDYPFNGMGRVELAKNMVNTGTDLEPVMVNTLTQDMFYKGAVGSRVPNTNTIFVIRYDYVLAENITIPDGCVLEFDGGSISNGTINFNGCLFNGDYKLTDVVFSGNVLNEKLLIGDEYIGVSNSDISDIVNSIISNTTVEIIEFTQSYTNLTKAIRVDRGFITIQGSNHNITLKNPTLDVSKAETFNFENNSSLTAIATIVIGKANTRLSHWNIRNITIQTMYSWEEIAANQFGVIVTGTHWTIEDCTIQGNTAGIKGYGVFCATMRNVIAQSINGAAYDFSEFAEGVNGTTMIIEECYAINSKIGYYLSTWVYSSLISTACDNSAECAYKFDHCAIECVSIGAESFKGSFIESTRSKVMVNGAYIVDYLGANGTLKTSETVDNNPRALIILANTGAISNSYSYMKIDGLTLNYYGPYISNQNSIESSYKLKNFDIGTNCLLEYNNSEVFRGETYPSSVLGSLGNNKYFFGNVAAFYGVDSYTFSKKNVDLHLIGSPNPNGKDIKNVFVDNINRESVSVNIVDGSPLFNNCENVVVRNCYILLNNTKLFADNTVQKNVIFDNCIIIPLNVAFNTIADSKIIFKDCLIQFDTDYVTPYITATNSDIQLINCTIKRSGGFVYGGTFVSGTSKDAGSTRPKNQLIGSIFFDATLGKPIWYDGNATTGWVDATGTTV